MRHHEKAAPRFTPTRAPAYPGWMGAVLHARRAPGGLSVWDDSRALGDTTQAHSSLHGRKPQAF